MTKHAPATPLAALPWISVPLGTGRTRRIQSASLNKNGDYVGDIYESKDAAYIARAANAYPKLVEALVTARDELRNARQHDAADRHGNLLRSLGEES